MSSWLARPFNFPVLNFFFKVSEVFHVYNSHKPAKTSIIVPKPYSFLVDSDATFDIGGGWNVDWKSSSWVGQAMLFPCFEGFFFKVPEVFLVYNFHKPAKTSIIVPKPYSFFRGFRRNVWHRRRMTCGSKMDLVSRPGHAVSPFWRFFFKVPEVFHVYNSHKPAKTSIIVPKPYSFLADWDATFDIGGGWHAVRKWTSWVGQTMLFPRSESFFFKASEVFLVYNFHKPAKTSIIVPKPYSFLVDSDATCDTGGGWHVDWKSSSWVGQAMQFPCFEGFFFKVPENFHVHNFHKPAKTSTIVPKPYYSFLVESDATFDIGGGWNAVRKSTSWVGQTMLFPRSEGFFSRPQEVFLVYNFHKPAKTSIIVPKPYSFLVDSDATFDIGGSWNVDWKCLRDWPGHSVSPFWIFFQGLRGLPCLQLTQACQNQHYRSKPSWIFLADSDATFDIGGNWNVDWKWSSWVGQAMQFPRFEGFFSRCQISSLSTTSTSLPKPALSYQNLIVF